MAPTPKQAIEFLANLKRNMRDDDDDIEDDTSYTGDPILLRNVLLIVFVIAAIIVIIIGISIYFMDRNERKKCEMIREEDRKREESRLRIRSWEMDAEEQERREQEEWRRSLQRRLNEDAIPWVVDVVAEVEEIERVVEELPAYDRVVSGAGLRGDDEDEALPPYSR